MIKILALILVIIGGCISYGAKKILPIVLKKEEITDGEIITTKFIGLLIVILAAIIVFII